MYNYNQYSPLVYPHTQPCFTMHECTTGSKVPPFTFIPIRQDPHLSIINGTQEGRVVPKGVITRWLPASDDLIDHGVCNL